MPKIYDRSNPFAQSLLAVGAKAKMGLSHREALKYQQAESSATTEFYLKPGAAQTATGSLFGFSLEAGIVELGPSLAKRRIQSLIES